MLNFKTALDAAVAARFMEENGGWIAGYVIEKLKSKGWTIAKKTLKVDKDGEVRALMQVKPKKKSNHAAVFDMRNILNEVALVVRDAPEVSFDMQHMVDGNYTVEKVDRICAGIVAVIAKTLEELKRCKGKPDPERIRDTLSADGYGWDRLDIKMVEGKDAKKR